MTSRTRTALLTTAALAALAMGGGCASDSDNTPRLEEAPTGSSAVVDGETAPADPATATSEVTEPSTPEVVHTLISNKSRGIYFPAYTREFRQWKSTATSNGNSESLTRSVPPCTDRPFSLPIDDEVLSFSDAVAKDGSFVVTRHLTLYPDAITAGQFADELGDETLGFGCDINGDEVTSVSSQDFGTDRFFGAADQTILFSEGQYGFDGGKPPYTYIDIVSVKDNAVMWTRVGSAAAVKGTSGRVTTDKEKNAAFVNAVRSQADSGTKILSLLQ